MPPGDCSVHIGNRGAEEQFDSTFSRVVQMVLTGWSWDGAVQRPTHCAPSREDQCNRGGVGVLGHSVY